MNDERNERSAVERELRSVKAPRPPADLAAKIKQQIPSADELAGGSGSNSSPRRSTTPWLRLAATVAIAGLAATVAWQALRSNAKEPAMEPTTRMLEDVARSQDSAKAQPVPPPPPAATSMLEAAPEAKMVGPKDRDGLDLSAGASTNSLPTSEALQRRRESEPVQPAEVDAVEIPESPEAVVYGSVEGGVSGGVPGGIAGGMVGTAPQSAAPRNEQELRPPARASAPKPESRQKSAAAFSTGDDALRVGGRADEKETSQPDTMIFRDAGVNRFVVTEQDRRSTFAIDVDSGSYSLARSYLERGTMPPPEAIRLEEFVNAMTYSDRAPGRDDFALFAEGSESPYPDAEGLRLLRFAVKAREIDPADRKPANLTFVVDVSGSMNQENRLGLVKRALGLLLDELTPDDRVALVVYGTEGRVLLRPTRDHGAIREAIERLVPEGSTNAEAGLKLGYDLADEAWTKGEINRIVLCSDGVANVGATGPESILARIGEQARRGIQLTAVGFGMGNYNDALMERLADQGDGTYHYVDQLDEARKVFVDNLTGTLQNVAKDAKIQVEFDPRTVERWRLLGYENRDVADRDFRNDRVDAGEVGSGQAATALYEVRLQPRVRPGDRLATLHVRWKSVDGDAGGRPGEVREISHELRASEAGRRLNRSSRDLRLAALAAAFAERLKGTRAGREIEWRDLARDGDDLAVDFPRDADVRGLADLIDRATRLSGSHGRDEKDRGFERRQREEPERGGNGRLDEPR